MTQTCARPPSRLLALAAALALSACSGEVGGGGDEDSSSGPELSQDGGAADPGGPTSDAGPGPDGGPPGGGDPGGPGPDAPEPDEGPVVPSGPDWDPLCTAMGEASDPNCFTQDVLFACEPGAPASSPARIRRILRDELTRASGHRLTSELGQNPFDPPLTASYSSYDRGVSVDATTLDLYLSVIDRPGQGWTAHDPGIRIRHVYDGNPYKCMWGDPDDACRDLWLSDFMEKGLLFRPPTPEEKADLRALLDAALDAETDSGLSRQQTLSQVVSAAWLMPGALFREELGGAEPDADGRHRLTNHELAQSLTYALTHRGPGATGSFHHQAGPGGDSWTAGPEGYHAEVRAAAADGSIQDPEVIEALVASLAGGLDPERNDLNVEHKYDDRRPQRGDYWLGSKVRDFFREYFDYAGFPTVFKDTAVATSVFTGEGFDPASIGGFSAGNVGSSYGNLQSGYYGKEPTLVQQLDDMIARIVVEDSDVFRQLLTSRRFYVASTNAGEPCTDDGQCANACLDGRCFNSSWKSLKFVALPYGVTEHLEPTEEGRWVDLPEDERAGVLTHPAWLAAHGDAFEDGPSVVHRGKWVREHLLCQYIPPLSKVEGIEAMLLPSSGDKSARMRIEESIEPNPQCMMCHLRMNALGYPFEMYNHAGFVRGWDHDPAGAPPDYQGAVDATTTLTTDNAIPDEGLLGDYDDAVDMMERFADSSYVKRCFIRHTFRYFAGRDETVADACTLAQMEQTYDDTGSFVTMLATLMASDTFTHRTQDPDAICEEGGR